MRKNIQYYLLYGIGSAAVVWAIQEFILFLVHGQLPPIFASSLLGAFTGGLFGGFMGAMDGFFTNSRYLMKKGLWTGTLIGFFTGLISFYLVFTVTAELVPEGNTILPLTLSSIRWVILALAICVAIGIRDKNQLSTIRGVISGLFTGICAGLLIGSLELYITSPFLLRGSGMLVFGALLAAAHYQFSLVGRKVWIKALNGKLEGMEIELNREIHLFGTQDNDDINLQDYIDVQQSHAKLIRYFDNYSLIDNDPFCQTFVNFRGIKEQFLKNGDILKIGTALFQYCTLD